MDIHFSPMPRWAAEMVGLTLHGMVFAHSIAALCLRMLLAMLGHLPMLAYAWFLLYPWTKDLSLMGVYVFSMLCLVLCTNDRTLCERARVRMPLCQGRTPYAWMLVSALARHTVTLGGRTSRTAF